LAEKGAWPMPLPDHYAADIEHVREYARLAATPEGFARYLDQYVHDRRAA
jgi:glutaconate CoA-transferase subunit A